jgi:nucleotide-binding universal stress UspA family protein
MNFKKIVFATDFSPASESALSYASALARDSGATLVITHIEELPLSYPGGEMMFVQPDYPNPVLQKMLEAVLPTDPVVPYEHHLRLGAAADEIVRLAQELDAGLIVIGTHGRTGLRRVLMGSVAEAVMRRATCPVLTIRAAADTGQEETNVVSSGTRQTGAAGPS